MSRIKPSPTKPKPITTKPSNEPVTGGSNTPMTPDRREILRATAAENAKNRGMVTRAKGGSIDGCASKGKTKTKMYAKGGSIDGIAIKGKTRCKGMK